MSSFHTAPHAAYWSRRQDETVESAGHEPAASTFYGGATTTPITAQDLDRIFAPVLDDWLPNASVGLGDLEATSAGAFNPTFVNPQSVPAAHGHMNTNFVDAWLTPTPQPNTVASTSSDAAWAGHIFPPVESVIEPLSNPLPGNIATSIWLSQAELAWPFEPGQFNGPMPLYAEGNGGMVGPYYDFPQGAGATSWGSAQLGATPVGMADIGYGAGHSWSHGANTLAPQRTRLGKRPRSDGLTGACPEELKGDQRPRPLKKVKGKMVASGVLEAAGSTSKAPLKSATKIPVEVSDISEEVGCGAGMLAAPNAHEVYHQFLPGPSVQKLAGTALGEPSWIEGSEVEATQHYASGVVQQHVLYSNAKVGERVDQERARFRIPKRLSQRHRSLLVATLEDLARETVHELKCRLCPGTGIGNWEDFKRHCDFMEAHPLKISFCKHCGDFFARSDSLKRHLKKRPPTCHDVSKAEAEAKRTATKQAHDAFLGELESLGTSGEAWTPFSQRITEMLHKSAKRGSRQQCRIKVPNA